MKKSIFAILGVSAAMVLGLSSCVGDLNVTPIDENIQLPKDVLKDQDAFKALLAKCYQGLCCSSSFGPDGGPDIDGVDGGYGQYMRAIVNLQEVSTDVATCCWNDGNLADIHNMTWNSSNEFVLSMYYRIFYQIGLCNEFIRQSNATDIEGYTDKAAYIAEARALRLLSYYHAIDMFGNIPFSTEENSVGSTGPEQKMRPDLFDWMVTEAQSLLDGSDLAAVGQNEYGRADKGLVQMILAKLYLNAEVWKGEAMYDKCAALCETIISEYPLHTNWADLFMADNHLWTKNTNYGGDELIFVAPQDGLTLQSYGSTNFLVFASTWSVAGDDTRTMDAAGDMGISSGWSGLSLTGTFTSKFADNDARATFFKGGFDQYVDQIRDDVGASNGYKSMKFRNVNHDGTAAQAAGFVDIDFPVFRSADAYLMYAECAARGAADKDKGLTYLNKIRHRANLDNLTTYTKEDVLDERARELYFEGHRRQDLVRFGLYTSGDYLWEFKGGVAGGAAVDSHYNLYPLTSGDTNANGNLIQNEGY